MSKPKTKSAVPYFAMEAEERTYWESTDSSQHLDWTKAKKAALPNLRPSTNIISLRLPQHLIDDIKVAANSRDVPYQLKADFTYCPVAATPHVTLKLSELLAGSSGMVKPVLSVVNAAGPRL
jgi:predicted DNA binding CopG/RHH family protein